MGRRIEFLGRCTRSHALIAAYDPQTHVHTVESQTSGKHKEIILNKHRFEFVALECEDKNPKRKQFGRHSEMPWEFTVPSVPLTRRGSNIRRRVLLLFQARPRGPRRCALQSYLLQSLHHVQDQFE